MATILEIKTELINVSIPRDFGKSFNALKKDIYKSYLADGYGMSDLFKSNNHGYSIFYTDNDNYMQGIKNGGGAGYFARLQGVGLVRTIKLENYKQR